MNKDLIEFQEEKEAELKKSSNRFLYSFIAIFILGYVFFFTSTLWLAPTYEGVEVTPIGEMVNANDRNIIIDSWTYAEDEELMEIIVEVENLSIDGINTYEWTVKDKNGLLKSEVVASDESFAVIQVMGVKKSWTEVSLNMSISPDDKAKNSEFATVTIYTNDKIVSKVSEIEKKSLKEYKKTAYAVKISSYENKIEDLEKEITDLNTQIATADEKISELTEKMKYETSAEKEQTNSSIESMQSERENLKDTINDKQMEIDELNEKIKLQSNLLNTI